MTEGHTEEYHEDDDEQLETGSVCARCTISEPDGEHLKLCQWPVREGDQLKTYHEDPVEKGAKDRVRYFTKDLANGEDIRRVDAT